MVAIVLRRACERAAITRPLCVMSLRHSHAVQRLENGVNLRRLQDELGHASIRTTERYEHCLAPRIDTHPFSEVRRRMAVYCGDDRLKPSHAAATASSAHRPPNAPPLAGLPTIDLGSLQLPFDPAADRSPAVRFCSFLKNRLFGAFIRTAVARSP